MIDSGVQPLPCEQKQWHDATKMTGRESPGPSLVVRGMATFTPPTYRAQRKPEQVNHPGQLSLWRWYDGIETGRTVLIRAGVVTPYPGAIAPPTDQITGTQQSNATHIEVGADAGSGENGLAYFRGGIPYEITAGEESLLNAAGYGAHIV